MRCLRKDVLFSSIENSRNPPADTIQSLLGVNEKQVNQRPEHSSKMTGRVLMRRIQSGICDNRKPTNNPPIIPFKTTALFWNLFPFSKKHLVLPKFLAN